MIQTPPSMAATTPSLGSSIQQNPLTRFRQAFTLSRFRQAITPTRLVLGGGSSPGTTTTLSYAQRHRSYTREQIRAWLGRLPLWVAGTVLVTWISPVGAIRIHGPSMLPTMMADETDIWLIVKYHWYHWLHMTPPTPNRGDLVGFGPPAPAGASEETATAGWWWSNILHNNNHNKDEQQRRISCKRVVGLPGDRVLRYGQYVHLYVAQDPIHRGVQWPEEEEGRDNNAWMNRNWDEPPPGDRTTSGLPPRVTTSSKEEEVSLPLDAESRRTIVVPEGHVWLEADCPGLGLDSRQFGPVPMEWLQGRIWGRIWPLWSRGPKNHSQRPHPIPLDEESLRDYNVYRVPRGNSNNNTSGSEF